MATRPGFIQKKRSCDESPPTKRSHVINHMTPFCIKLGLVANLISEHISFPHEGPLLEPLGFFEISSGSYHPVNLFIFVISSSFHPLASASASNSRSQDTTSSSSNLKGKIVELTIHLGFHRCHQCVNCRADKNALLLK